ncbi:MAG: discoidin domain-containing protein [Paludibacteraceae bacterium]
MSLVKPGKTTGGVTVGASESVYFIVDLGTAKKFDYIVWEHRNNTSTGLRVWEASFYGSNDGNTFNEIKTNVPIPGAQISSTYKGTIDIPSSEYRYLKVAYTKWDTVNNATMQIGEFWLGATSVQ